MLLVIHSTLSHDIFHKQGSIFFVFRSLFRTALCKTTCTMTAMAAMAAMTETSREFPYTAFSSTKFAFTYSISMQFSDELSLRELEQKFFAEY